MGKKRRHGGRFSTRGVRRARPRRRDTDEPDLLLDVRAAVEAGDLLALLVMASGMIELGTTRPLDRFDAGRRDLPSIATLVTTFVEVDRPETTALLTVLGSLLDDELLVARIRRELEARTALPLDWLTLLDTVSVTRAWNVGHVLGDSDTIMVGARWLSGQELTVVALVDHNMGTIVSDAFVVSESVGILLREGGQAIDDPDITATELAPADARARLRQAIDTGEHMLPPIETETWPTCRSLVEWLLRKVPDGGTGYVRPEWSERDRDDLADDFLRSPDGEPFAGDDDAVGAVSSLIWFGCDYGPGDPLRWSPIAVEILLADWAPRKLMLVPDELAAVPRVLRAFVRYADARRGIPDRLNAETMDAIDEFADEDPDAVFDGPTYDGIFRDHMAWVIDDLATEVGGHDVLDQLDTTTIPDEPFDWSVVPSDLEPRIAAVLALSDKACDEWFGVECRTIARRLLARAVAGDPSVFRRRARDEITAAAVVWLVGRANDRFHGGDGGVLVKDLLAWFGHPNATLSQRGRAIGAAAGMAYVEYGFYAGDVALLESSRRAAIISRRDWANRDLSQAD